MIDPGAAYICPACRMVNTDVIDVATGFCSNCQEHTAYHERPRCLEPACPDFGDHDFGEGTCPSEHAMPPAWR